MPLDLSSANWKIDRANELLRALDAEVHAWQGTTPYSFYTYVNPEFMRASVTVKEHNAPPIIRWSLFFADIIHNLRCALDHAFWALLQSEFSSGLSPKVERLSFPIWDSPPNAAQKGNYQPVGHKLFVAIESVQPYNRPTTQFPVHPLAIIRDIDNRNKHKLLFALMPCVSSIKVDIDAHRPLKSTRYEPHYEKYMGELKDGVEAIVTTFIRPEPYLKYTCTELSIIIAVKHPVADRLGRDRDDYAALVDVLISQVRETINALVSFVV